MKVVIDTNLLLRSISSKSSSHWLYLGILEGSFALCVSTDILNEYAEIIEWGFRKVEIADSVLESIVNSAHIIQTEVYFFWSLIRSDPDDNKFCDCAIAANADYIVTDDGHFKELQKIDFPRVQVLSLELFLKVLTESETSKQPL